MGWEKQDGEETKEEAEKKNILISEVIVIN